MRKIFFTIFLTLALALPTLAQETYFGKNKVRYRDFDWSYIQTRRFDIYFYGEAYSIAKFAADVLESSYQEISDELNYNLQDRVPVFIYGSHNDMMQTNIVSSMLSEGIGGFTESFKNRVAVPFTGSYEDFRHVLHHELTHAIVNNMLFGKSFSSLISRNRLFNLPAWFAEGFAEYSSRHGWDYNSDMFMRDATINDYLVPPEYLQYNYFAYRQGQAMVKYIADEYGEDKLYKILQKGKILLSMNKAIEAVLGIEMKEFWEKFSKEMKRRYWPTITTLKEPKEIGKQLTKAREDGSYFNEKPVFSPDGDKIAMFTDRSDFTEIVLISPYDGKLLKRLVKSARSGDLESLHAYVSGMAFSPEGNLLVFVAKSNGRESLFFARTDNGDVIRKVPTQFDNMINPSWSRDGRLVAFAALSGSKRDIYTYDVENGAFEQITDDRYDDDEPNWLPDSRELVFVSDRPHPQNAVIDREGHPYLFSADAYMPGDFEYGTYNIFRVDRTNRRVTPVDVGAGHNRQPSVSPEGDKISFISNRNGIDNIYIGSLDTVEYYAVTNIQTGVRHASWSPTGDKIVFSAYNQGAFDILILEDLIPQGENGVLALTGFMTGEYDLLGKPAEEENAVAAAVTEPDPAQPVDSVEVLEVAEAPESEEPPVEASESTEDDALAATIEGGEAATVTPEDSTGTEEVAEADDSGDDGIITETGVYDDEYVYVGTPEEVALDAVMQEVERGRDSSDIGYRRQEPKFFDSIPPMMASGEYRIRKYKAKLTTDYVGGNFSYDTFFGMGGQTVFIFSDYLGNHQLFLSTYIVNSLDQSYLQAVYFNNKKRTSLGAGLFHTKNYYEDNYGYLFSDRFYGVQGIASRPFSTFSRVEAMVNQVFIDRKYYDRALGDNRPNRSSEITSLTTSYVFDNVLWGYTGPVNGRRFKLTLDGGKNFFDSDDIGFYSVGMDYRHYWHLDRRVSMAFRMSGGASFGQTPKQFFVGGTTNWIGSRTLEANVYDVENLYFADVITPLRGQEYYGLSGDRYALLNWELRFPAIQYFAMKYPLPLVFSNISGAIFMDMGAAWYGSEFKGGTSQGEFSRLQDIKTGVGMGLRMNLFGFALLRYDLAWATDFHKMADKPTSYFSFGADF